MRRCYKAGLLSLYSLCLPIICSAQELSASQVNGVIQRLAEGAKQSWELGTRAEAIIEYNQPDYSVLNDTSLPPSQDSPPSTLSDVFNIVKSVVSNRTQSNGNIQGAQPLIKDGSAADPASIGFAVLLANWTGQSEVDGLNYNGAAQDQLDFLLTQVPRTPDGALSHRVSDVQLWSDFVYMVPPFLAYYGVLTNNESLIQQAYDQIRLYRNYLADDSAGGLWRHIVLGPSGNDAGHWSTGNGWAAAGIMRVFATIQNSSFKKSFKNQANDLKDWADQIVGAMYSNIQSNGLFTNYADNSSTFLDGSSTALIASVSYRLSLLAGIHQHLPNAERSRQALSASSDSSGSLAHFTSDMWLTPVVNPHSFGVEGSESPEGQAFVVEMQSAWRDWVNDGSKGKNGARRTISGSSLVGWFAMGVGLVVLLG